VRLSEDARQSDQNQQPKQCLCRAFMTAHGKRAIHCRALLRKAHGKLHCLPCVFGQAHGKGCSTPFGASAVRCFCLPCVVKKRTANLVYRALSAATHGKGASPCKMLSCALCRAPRQKTHGKGFAVRLYAFAVRSGRTAKPLFPVVHLASGFTCGCARDTFLLNNP
jgi:hypothetical protein